MFFFSNETLEIVRDKYKTTFVPSLQTRVSCWFSIYCPSASRHPPPPTPPIPSHNHYVKHLCQGLWAAGCMPCGPPCAGWLCPSRSISSIVGKTMEEIAVIEHPQALNVAACQRSDWWRQAISLDIVVLDEAFVGAALFLPHLLLRDQTKLTGQSETEIFVIQT